jgi:Carboxypeptidase regulatory-like domain
VTLDRNKLCMGRVRNKCTVIFLAIAIAQLASASCETELSKIVRTAQGRVKGTHDEAIADAQVTVTSSLDDVIFRTKSGHDGSFRLAANPGKYRVEVEAKGYLRLVYIVDLRSGVVEEPQGIPLQRSGECNDMHIASEQDTPEAKCGSEVLPQNLTLGTATMISGKVKDESGEPFKNSEIVLKKLSDSPLQPGYLFTKTDDAGTFAFDEAEPGEYRLLASPSRAFAQPAKLDCYERRGCSLEITLKANGTDLPYAACPVR